MKSLLGSLGAAVARNLEPPGEPRMVMDAFCRAMSEHRGRPIDLVFRAFPEEIPVSGMRLDCGDRSIIVVEERTPPESQLVIPGHDPWHEEQEDCAHHVPGLPAATARTLGSTDPTDAISHALHRPRTLAPIRERMAPQETRTHA
ncbi:hypothetical protein ACWDCL_28545 [Streptomyces sp. NPDC001009]